MAHLLLLESQRKNRSFVTRARPKRHFTLNESLKTLRQKFADVDTEDLDFASIDYLKEKVRKAKGFDESPVTIEQAVAAWESKKPEQQKEVIRIRRNQSVFYEGPRNFLVFLPRNIAITVPCHPESTLAEFKQVIMSHAKRLPNSDDLLERTRYIYEFFDCDGQICRIHDDRRRIEDLNIFYPYMDLLEPDGLQTELQLEEYIAVTIGIPLHKFEESLNEESYKFRLDMFESMFKSEHLRGREGLTHWAFPEETVIHNFKIDLKPEDSNEIYETDLEKLEFGDKDEENEKRAMERLRRKIESSQAVCHVYYRPDDTDETAVFAEIGENSHNGIRLEDTTPSQLIIMALEVIERKEKIEIKIKPEDFLLQVVGRQAFVTKELPLKKYEYVRSCFENFRTPTLLLRTRESVFAEYPTPTPVFVPSLIRSMKAIASETEALKIQEEEKKKIADLKDAVPSIIALDDDAISRSASLPSPAVADPMLGDIPEAKEDLKMNFWEIEEDFRIRIHSASHLIVPDVNKIYIKAAVVIGGNIITTMNSKMVSPSNPRWDSCNLDFGHYYKDIPKSAQMCFSLIAQSEDGETQTPLGWHNMRLFDWEDKFVQGKFTVFFWPFPNDPIAQQLLCNVYGGVGNEFTEADAIGRLDIEFREFNYTIEYPTWEVILKYGWNVITRQNYNRPEYETRHITDFSEGSENLKKLFYLRKVMDVKTITPEDQWFLWGARKAISKYFPSFLPLLYALPMVWKKRDMYCELYYMLEKWPLMQVDAAMELLDSRCPDVWFRECAVNRIDRALDDDHLQLYILPLVQALRYEPYSDNALSKFLVKRAMLNYRIGHTLFWLLRAELNYFNLSPTTTAIPQFCARFAICIEMCQRVMADYLPGIVKQVKLIDELTKINTDIKGMDPLTHAEVLRGILDEKKALLEDMTSPLNPCDRLGELQLDQCRVLGSAKQPLFLTWLNPQPLSRVIGCETHQIIFKLGDDLRQDMLTLQTMRIMDAKWKNRNLDFCMTCYEVLPMGKNIGMIHVVAKCDTLYQIQRKSEGLLSPLKMGKNMLNNHLHEVSPDTKSYLEGVDRFTYSLAGSCVSTYVLGVKDRHQDNIMMAHDGRIFHIDFGHILGHYKKKLNIKRERTDFVLTTHFIHLVTRGKSNYKRTYEYQSLRESCAEGFQVLHNSARFFIIYFRMMLCMGLPELATTENVDYLRESLMYDMKPDEAKAAFLEKFDKVVELDWTVSLNWMFHSLKHYKK
uniref:Ubiquitinyl hydrolase 1 n=1 Tax=Panagrellus redivivus TaxID=6233 RepID=A0A7E4ZV14_PANRE